MTVGEVTESYFVKCAYITLKEREGVGNIKEIPACIYVYDFERKHMAKSEVFAIVQHSCFGFIQ